MSVFGKLTKVLEIYENERFVFTKFSSKSLLPTDRRCYSVADGTPSWNTLEEAEIALTSIGWLGTSECSAWMPAKDSPNSDVEGWTYDVDFGNFQNASGEKKMHHFVRRRRLTRTVDFDATRIGRCDSSQIKVSCDHCCTLETENISTQLLYKLAELSIKISHKNIPHAVTMNPIKSRLLSALLGTDSVGMLKLLSTITSYQEQSTWDKMFSHVDKKGEDISRRATDFPNFEEKILVAQAIIKKHDLNFEFHCDQLNCGPACQFCPETCGNSGCGYVFSKKWFSMHDNECPHKIIPCPRVCGDTFPRRQTEKHMADICPLRPVSCPFADVGCSSPLLFKEVPAHLDSCIQVDE